MPESLARSMITTITHLSEVVKLVIWSDIILTYFIKNTSHKIWSTGVHRPSHKDKYLTLGFDHFKWRNLVYYVLASKMLLWGKWRSLGCDLGDDEKVPCSPISLSLISLFTQILPLVIQTILYKLGKLTYTIRYLSKDRGLSFLGNQGRTPSEHHLK